MLDDDNPAMDNEALLAEAENDYLVSDSEEISIAERNLHVQQSIAASLLVIARTGLPIEVIQEVPQQADIDFYKKHNPNVN